MSDLLKTQLRPYQLEIVNAILDSIINKKGLTFTVEIARQGGKNELSSRLELVLLTAFMLESKNLIKCSPTFKPQTVISMLRLKEKLNAAGFGGKWTSEMGYIIRLVESRAIFLSADESANVVGNTAHILLEVDEAQDVDEDKYAKEFKPMGSTTNVTGVLYGTTWDDSTLLEKMKQTNLEMEKKDGIKRHFRCDWQEVAKYNPDYLAYVEAESNRLGENHPLFLTQYRLLPVHGGGGFLSPLQKSQLQGVHSRLHHPPSHDSELTTHNSKIYVAGIDLAGEAETVEDDFLKNPQMKQDSTVVTIGEVEILPILPMPNSTNNSIPLSSLNTQNFNLTTIRVVEHYAWTGRKHHELYPQLIDLIKNVWRCRAVVIDATGIGEPVSSFLRQAVGSRIIPFKFSAQSKTELGFNLLAAVNSGSLKIYAADNSPQYREFWYQIERAKGYYRPSRTMNFYVDPSDGHDDYLMSLALLVEAAKYYQPREAKGR